MDKWLLIATALALGVAAGLVVWQRRRTARLMDSIERMLRAAMDGSFAEEAFDESRLSRLETELSHYLSASVVSSAHVAEERDKIKELMLIIEGLFYALSAAALALGISLIISPLGIHLMEKTFWFLHPRFVIYPVLASIPVFALLGWLIPTILYGQEAHRSVAEQLREAA